MWHRFLETKYYPAYMLNKAYLLQCISTHILYFIGSRDSLTGIATGYGLDDRGVGDLVPVG
jgi:hypothetical protein